MATERAELPPIADPTIDQVFDEFLAEQAQRLKPKTLSKYRSVISLLRHSLNSYAYQGLSGEESALFDRHCNAEGEMHREFCGVFGPGEVMCGAELKRSAGTVTKRLSKWLAAKGYVAEEEAALGAEEGADAGRTLPVAEIAAQALADRGSPFFDPSDLPDEDYMDFDHYTIAKIAPGGLWVELPIGGVVGPITVPKKAMSLLQEGWEISCAMARLRGKWRLVEVANVYPH